MLKILAGFGAVAALTGCAIGAMPQQYGTVTSIEPHWETVSFFPPESNCTVYRNDQVELSTTGAIIGAGAGYILSGGLLVPTLGAAGAGAVAFGEIDNGSVICENANLPPQDQQVISHFNVVYEYNGYEAKGTSMTQYSVGDSIPLNFATAYAKPKEEIAATDMGPIPTVEK